MAARLKIVLIAACLCGCSKEAREIGPTVPQTRPAVAGDPRISSYQGNVYQIAQGGRYFSWYGCSACHTGSASGVLNLADGAWHNGGEFAQVFGAVADRHGRLGYGSRIPMEQLWQLTAYVRDLPRHYPEKRRRLALDQRAEPQGSTWVGPQ